MSVLISSYEFKWAVLQAHRWVQAKHLYLGIVEEGPGEGLGQNLWPPPGHMSNIG